jgi:hypothetical protein
MNDFIGSAEVLIQAGHVNRNVWDTSNGAVGAMGSEEDWTPIVADEAARILTQAGVSVIKTDASIKLKSKTPESARKVFHVKTAVFIHFDGVEEGTKGASIGFKDEASKPGALRWKELYSNYWHFPWRVDNGTTNLREYYGYKNVIATDSAVVLELGDIGDQVQASWLQPRLLKIGHVIAHFLASRIGKAGLVPAPDLADF